MLFNSSEFIFLFLPLTLWLFFFSAKKWGNNVAIWSLVFCSLFFYAWWNPKYLALLLSSMLANYVIGRHLSQSANKILLVLGISANLAAIAYFKYAGFVVDNINLITGNNWHLGTIILPLAISFFTFQQIAYLVDSYKGITKEYNFIHYALFVSFFPQLIAGPIVHHKEMLPQFAQSKRFAMQTENLMIGLSIFAIGLFKKTVLADGIAVYATPVFAMADGGQSIDLFTAWGGALAYTFQLYFDFSGYSDMAIGLARIFGIVLPLNFYSPYKATNISEFWRRWHMTLSKFLRDYVYIALGGNRHGKARRYINLSLTMLLGGLWHGAGWNFIIWGGLHGFYLTINHSWQAITKDYTTTLANSKCYQVCAWSLTFFAVLIGWVFFRATTLDGAFNMLAGMFGLNGVQIPNAILVRLGDLGQTLQALGVEASYGGTVFVYTWLWNFAMLIAVLTLPNVQDLFNKYKGTLSPLSFESVNTFWPMRAQLGVFTWLPSRRWAFVCAAALALGMLTLSQVSEFLYFQF